jgi:hypothetical protein
MLTKRTGICLKMNYNVVFIFYFILSIHSYDVKAQNQHGANNYLSTVKSYADALVEQGRDKYGEIHSPLFASVLNRETMEIEPSIASIKIPGVRERDRSVTGANMIHDEDLLQILYALSELTGEKSYANEADNAIAYFFNNCQSPTTGLMCWGEHLYWDFLNDDCGYSPDYDFHEAKAWPFWDKTYELAPDAAWEFVIGEWDHQIHDKTSGDFSRHGRYSKHETFSGFDFPRYAGQMMERWADAYNRPENASRERKEELLNYIETVFNRMEDNSDFSESGLLIAGRSSHADHNSVVWLTNNLELARCLEVVAPTVNPELAEKMREFALKQDNDFLKAPHKLDSLDGGFAVTLHAKTGLPRTRAMNKPYTSTWSSGYGYGTHAEVANTIYGRYKSIKNDHADLAGQYKSIILAVGNKYLASEPDTSILLKPNEFAEVIDLMLNCYQLSNENKFLARAEFFAQSGISLFLTDGSPLPRASNQHKHYESITGGPSFMYRLLKLYQQIQKQ